ncbi:MAG: hypoxanthine phosphoribosyltransferase [Candidatus Zophobacter franzmannii]|jgi:hypoxanthine phosphoribosyltransferase|nr:hypoxanthine phosphoribosyltransferase [Candidatus Zophobacter franzmannii]
MIKDIEKVLITEEEIASKIAEIGENITRDFTGKEPIFICVLKGASIFMSDLIRQIDLPCAIDFMAISSYGDSTVSSGVVQIKKDVDTDLTGKDVIIIEDIVDSGLSLEYIRTYLATHNPNSVSVCVLLDKPKAHKTDVTIEYVGFELGNEFVVGYGLDFAGKYRNLPYIGILKEEVYL